jgi:hypothetical protein
MFGNWQRWLHICGGLLLVGAYWLVRAFRSERPKSLREFFLNCGKIQWIPRGQRAYCFAVSLRQCWRLDDWSLARKVLAEVMSVFDWARVKPDLARIVLELSLLGENREVSNAALLRLETLKMDEQWMRPVVEWNSGSLSLSALSVRFGTSSLTITLPPLRYIVLAALAEEQMRYVAAADNLESLSRLHVYSENMQQKVLARANKMRAMAAGDVVPIDYSKKG